jgi:hypothetical protein
MDINDLIKQFKELKDQRTTEYKEESKHFVGGTGELRANDRWKNRSAEMRCHSCMHYVSKIDDKGRCRRHAPTLEGWPVVFETDWCGDHKLS